MPEFTADVVISDQQQLDRLLKKAVAQELQQFLRKVKPQIEDGSRQYVSEAIMASPEWKSLLEVSTEERASLRVHFGLAEPAPILNRIVKAVQDGIQVDPIRPSGDILGGFVVKILPNDYAAELAVDGAQYTSVGKRGSHLIPWLKWLLVGGAGIILANAEMLYFPAMQSFEKQLTLARSGIHTFAGSRTGPAIMLEPKKRAARGWQVPAEFAGTQDNNWLTRAMADFEVGSKICSLFRNLMTA